MARLRWRRLTLSVVLTLAAAACAASGSGDPKDQLIDAFRAMRADGGTVVDLSLAMDDATLAALQADADEPLPPQMAVVIKTASMRISMPLASDATSGAFAFRVADEQLFEIRTIDDAVYARADVPRLLEAVGQDPAMAEGFREMLASSGMLPADVVDGRWVKLTGTEQALDAFGGAGDAGTPEFDPAALQAAGTRIAGVLAQASTVERIGTDGDGDHLRASVPLREAYTALMAEVDGLGLPVPAHERTAVEDIPDADVAVDLWVKGGRVSAAEFDLLQVAALDPEADIPEGVTRLALRAVFTPFDGVVDVPADAVEIDVSALMQQLFMGMPLSMGESMGGMGTFDPSMMPPGYDPSMMPPGYPQPAPAPNG